MNINDFSLKLIPKEIDNEKKGYILNTISHIMFGLLHFETKLISLFAEDVYSTNNFMLWRSLCTFLIGYLLSRYKNIEITKYNEFKTPYWFLARILLVYMCFYSFAESLLYIRLSTSSCITTLAPVLFTFLAIIILKEKFHIRYVYGLIICILGAFCIVSNERNGDNNINNGKNFIIGILYALVNLIGVSFMTISIKILSSQSLSFETQSVYIGISNSIIVILVSIFQRNDFFNTSFTFIFLSMLNSVIFFIAHNFLLESFKLIETTKTAHITYLAILTVFILGVVFLNNKIFFWDYIGCFLIIGYNLYNTYYPVK